MSRTIAILAASLAFCAAGVTTWNVLQLPLAPLIVPGAVDVQVSATSWGAAADHVSRARAALRLVLRDSRAPCATRLDRARPLAPQWDGFCV
jgi:hypothetical protein